MEIRNASISFANEEAKALKNYEVKIKKHFRMSLTKKIQHYN